MMKRSKSTTGVREARVRSRAARPGRRLLFTLIIWVFGLLVAGGVPLAQAQSPITAEVDRTTISLDEQVTLTVTVTGDFLTVPTPDLGDLAADFNVVGKSEATQISIVNGKITAQKSFVYRLQPLRLGSITISQVTVDIDGLTYRTAPISIQVIAGVQPAPGPPRAVPANPAPDGLPGQDFFVEAAVSNPSPLLGEQIVYTFKLYQASNFLGQPDYRPPGFTDFWSQSILSQPRYNLQADGREYIVTEMRTALFPSRLGSITIDPAKLVVPGGLFEPDVVLETDPVTVMVQALPRNAPPDFDGAVGQFNIEAHFNETEAQVNEPVTFVLSISGAGNIEKLAEPTLPELTDWRVFESQMSTSVEPQGDTIYGTRSFERLMVPGQPGSYTFPPVSFSYYDPAARAYQTVHTDPLPITVKPGKAEPPAVTASGTDKQQVELLAGDIRHIKSVPTALTNTDVSLLNNGLYWSLWVAPALLVVAFWAWQNRQQRLSANVAYMRSSKARKKALDRLSQAQRSGEDSYGAAHHALLDYLADKLNRPTAGLTTNNLVGLLKTTRLDPDLIERIRSALDQIDLARFAPGGESAARSFVAEVHLLINDLEKSFATHRSGK